MAAKPTIAMVGPGNVATALALSLRKAGYRITEVVSRDLPESKARARTLARKTKARAATHADAALHADLVWLCVTDDAIAPTARALAGNTDRAANRKGNRIPNPKAGWKGKIALHSSGALTSDQLAPLRRRGASVAALHPMMTFVRGASPSMKGVPFAVEGDPAAVAVARRIARDLGGNAFPIRKRNKTLYHAFGSFSSPLMIATLAMAEKVALAAGVPRASVRDAMLPITRRTFENFLRGGTAAAFSGPINRGDVRTVARHLKALRKVKGAREIYLALARSVLDTLPVKNRAALRRLLNH
ncbi:MAG: Rossmann-like and DUF2520 domain-containing protein [Terriglobales bacterium]